MRRPPANLAASVHDRLLALSRQRREGFQLLQTRYAQERLLYRLTRSRHSRQFVLKGALLYTIWNDQPYRPTRDLDLLGYGDGSAEGLRAAFQEICSVSVEPDGLEFDPDHIEVSEIRENQEYGGKRIRLMARLGSSHIVLRVDIGFGDAVTPGVQNQLFPVLLGEMPRPYVQTYPRETVVSEKLQTIVVLGMMNSQMKDLFDLDVMATRFSFDGPILVQAIRATFNRRKTLIPREPPLALLDAFAEDAAKGKQWQAFLHRGDMEAVALPVTMKRLQAFALPPLMAAGQDEGFDRIWPKGGPWLEGITDLQRTDSSSP